MRITEQDRVRFNGKFTRGLGCWLWTPTGRVGCRTGPQYGVFKLHGMRSATTAHRAAWLINRGAVPNGLFVLHKCDVPTCVRPSHLFLGTKLDNARDMVAKGRHVHGERAVHGKLSTKKVLKIREDYAKDRKTPTQLAHQHGVHLRTIWNIIRRERWAHLPG